MVRRTGTSSPTTGTPTTVAPTAACPPLAQVLGAHSGGGGGSGYINEDGLVINGATTTATVKCGFAGASGANGEVRLSPVS